MAERSIIHKAIDKYKYICIKMQIWRVNLYDKLQTICRTLLRLTSYHMQMGTCRLIDD